MCIKAIDIDLAGMPAAELFDMNGTKFPMVSCGSGVPVLFVHGAWADHRIWCGVWRPVSRSAKFMAITMRHFGLAEWPNDKPYSREVHTDDLIETLRKLDEPAHVVGWSYAGGVVLRAAAVAPEHVRSLTIFEPSFESENTPEAGALSTARDDAWKRLEPAYRLAESGRLQAAMRCGLEAVYGMKEGGFFELHPDFQKVHMDNCHTMLPDLHAVPAQPIAAGEFLRILCPVQILYGENTQEQYRLMAEQTSSRIRSATLVKIPGVSHGGPVQRPDLLSRAVLDFIARSETAA